MSSATSSPPATAREAFERGAAWARSLYRANYDGSTQRVDTNATTTAPASPPQSSYRIVGGAEVDPERTYPWMTTFKPFGCGASLVAPNKVLSAAHCDLKVRYV